MFKRVERGFGAVGDPNLVEDVRKVAGDGALADVELVANLPVGLSVGHQRQHLALAPMEVPSHGGCVSTVASRGNPVAARDYSHAAYVAQCKMLQDVLPAELWNAPVEIVQTNEGPMNIGGFGGKVQTCTYLLHGYHSGTLSHPE